MAKLGRVRFTGKSGQTYVFNVYPIDTPLKEVGGIYCITRRYKNSNKKYVHKLIYIGRTEDLSTRFDGHHKDECFVENDANCICTYSEDDHDLRCTKETDLINRHNPPCNG